MVSTPTIRRSPTDSKPQTLPSVHSSSFDRLLSAIDPAVAGPIEKALSGRDLTAADAERLFAIADDHELNALLSAADRLRQETVGDVVTYVRNRNINFANRCVKECGFCAYHKDWREEDARFYSLDHIVHLAVEAREAYGATEVCIQAGLDMQAEPDIYVQICRAIKEAVPDMHIHACSPEEVKFYSRRLHISIEEFLKSLKEAGLGSLPGTSAEILGDDALRQEISPGRIRTGEWLDVVRTAHRLGIPTTSTIMYGHKESAAHKARHLEILRNLQRETHGFTEFVPLSFVHYEAPMWKHGLVEDLRPGASLDEVLKMYAVSRLFLNRDIPNLQVTWVKQGPKLAQMCLLAGGNDFGGTLINESISTAAGASYGQYLSPEEMEVLIRAAGRVPRERTTLYRPVERAAGERNP